MTRNLPAIESELIATTDPQRHTELRAELAAAGLPHLAAELGRIAAGPVAPRRQLDDSTHRPQS